MLFTVIADYTNNQTITGRAHVGVGDWPSDNIHRWAASTPLCSPAEHVKLRGSDMSAAPCTHLQQKPRPTPLASPIMANDSSSWVYGFGGS